MGAVRAAGAFGYLTPGLTSGGRTDSTGLPGAVTFAGGASVPVSERVVLSGDVAGQVVLDAVRFGPLEQTHLYHTLEDTDTAPLRTVVLRTPVVAATSADGSEFLFGHYTSAVSAFGARALLGERLTIAGALVTPIGHAGLTFAPMVVISAGVAF
jgi:hypothetical protein